MSAEKPDPLAPKAATLLEAVVRDIASAAVYGGHDVVFKLTEPVDRLPGRPDEPRMRALAVVDETGRNAELWTECAHKLINHLNDYFGADLDPAAIPVEKP